MQNCFEVISLSGVFRVKQFDETVTEICINILFGYFCVYFRGDDEAQEKFVNYLKVGPRWLKYRFVFFWIIVFGLWWQRAAYVCANAIHNCWHRCFSKYFLSWPSRASYERTPWLDPRNSQPPFFSLRGAAEVPTRRGGVTRRRQRYDEQRI
mmetsp:Transcript_8486/g.24071  ORF Transcript_8486/g.24071 Transcript_8486/m.24071 type:complete len:152 (-) Transcript_8486:726-1181(-)